MRRSLSRAAFVAFAVLASGCAKQAPSVLGTLEWDRIALPAPVAEKIVAHHRIFRNSRFLLQMAIGLMPHDHILRGIELYGTKVAPLVREMLAAEPVDTAQASA